MRFDESCTKLHISVMIEAFMKQTNGWLEWCFQGTSLAELKPTTSRKTRQSPDFKQCNVKGYMSVESQKNRGLTLEIVFPSGPNSNPEDSRASYSIQCTESGLDKKRDIDIPPWSETNTFEISGVNFDADSVLTFRFKIWSSFIPHEASEFSLITLSLCDNALSSDISQEFKHCNRLCQFKMDESSVQSVLKVKTSTSGEVYRRIVCDKIGIDDEKILAAFDTESIPYNIGDLDGLYEISFKIEMIAIPLEYVHIFKKMIDLKNQQHATAPKHIYDRLLSWTEQQADSAGHESKACCCETLEEENNGLKQQLKQRAWSKLVPIIDHENLRHKLEDIERTNTSTEGLHDRGLYEEHSEIIKRWNAETIAALDKATMTLDQRDKKKDRAPRLFDKFVDCVSLIRVQKALFDDVSVSELIKRKNSISESIKEHEEKLASEQQKSSTLQREYESIKAEETELKQQLVDLVNKCNAKRQQQNNLNRQALAANRDKQRIEDELERLQSSQDAYLSVINQRDECVANINQRFESLWTTFEAQHKQWSIMDIVYWFKHKLNNMNTENITIDWDNVKTQLSKMTHPSLSDFNHAVFEVIGINEAEITTHLLSEIERLKERFGVNDNNAVKIKTEPSALDKDEYIPKKFICPLRKTIMEDPVIAFDGNSYERSEIDEYLKKYRKSPITGADASNTALFPNNNLREEIERFVGGRIILNKNNGKKRQIPTEDSDLEIIEPLSKKAKHNEDSDLEIIEPPSKKAKHNDMQ